MRVVDEVQLSEFNARPSGITYGSVPALIASGCDLVSILQVNWCYETLTAGTSLIATALSTDPEHVANPPDEIAEFYTNHSLYARAIWSNVINTNGINWAESLQHRAPQVIPLHGLIRPTRQIMTYMNIQSGASGMICEVIYKPVEATQLEINYINDKYGKYRRD